MRPLLAAYMLLFLIPFAVQAQDRQKEIDSLIRQANSLPEDSTKAKVLSRIHERMMFMDNEKALGFAREALELSKKIGYKKGVANGFLQFGNYYYNQTKNDSAIYYHELALSKFEEIESIRGQIFALHSIASIARENGNYDKAIDLTQTILGMYTEENRKNSDLGKFDLRGSEYEVLGGIYFEQGKYQLSLQNTLEAVRLFEEVGDQVRIGDGLKQLADIEYQLENYKSSLKYAREAVEIYQANSDKIYHSYAGNTAGLAAQQLGQRELAQEYFTTSLSLAREMNIMSMISKNLNDLARLAYQESNYSRARQFLEESLEISRNGNIQLGLTATLQELANLDVEQGNYSRALSSIREVVDIAEEIGALPTLKEALETRAEIYSKLGRNLEAYADQKRFQILNDSIYNLRRNQQIEELKTIFETERKENQIALQDEEIRTLNEKAKVDRLTRGLYAGGMFTFVAVSGLIYFGFRQRIKRNRMEREKQEEIYLKEIEHKKKELASQTLHLVQKNTFIQELMENLESIKNSPEKFKMEFRRMVMLLKKENASDKDWEVFKTYFSEVHNDFDQKIKTFYPEITEKEIRLAAFLRMNLTTKEIATTLNVLPESILKSKYRLKKKLGLDRETDLGTFLGSL